MLPISAIPYTPSSDETLVDANQSGTKSHTESTPPSKWRGIVLSASIGLCAWWLGTVFPLIGGPVIGILLGIAWRNTLGLPHSFAPGVSYSGKQVLKWSIIGLGFGLNINQVVQTGAASLSVTLVTISAAFMTAWLLGKLLKMTGGLSLLIGVGTAICGGSAIAATAPIIRSEDHDTALAISTIFLFNIVAVLAFPAIGHLLGMTDSGFGLWAGTAINDTSSVVAAGYSYSTAAGDAATIVKLTRATLIIPVCIIIAVWAILKNRGQDTKISFIKIFPWFIIWFLAATLISSFGLLPAVLQSPISLLSHFMIIMALTAIGLSSDLRQMALAGVKPLLLGFGVWMAVSISSLVVQYMMGSL